MEESYDCTIGMLRGGVHGVCDRGEFFESSTTMKARISGMEGALDFQCGMALVEGYYLYRTKSSCGKY